MAATKKAVELPEEILDVVPIASMCDEDWPEYVLSHFARKELDNEGRPKWAGLKRVTELLVGPTISSDIQIVQPPRFAPAGGQRVLSEPVVMVCKMDIYFCKGEFEDSPHKRVLCDAADLSDDNIGKDKFFLRFPTPTLVTRVESRILRKLHRLQAASEECGGGGLPHTPELAEEDPEFITDEQIALITALCKRCGIEPRLLLSGVGGYIRNLPFEQAKEMCKTLSGYQAKPGTIPEHLKASKKGSNLR